MQLKGEAGEDAVMVSAINEGELVFEQNLLVLWPVKEAGVPLPPGGASVRLVGKAGEEYVAGGGGRLGLAGGESWVQPSVVGASSDSLHQTCRSPSGNTGR